MPRIHKDGTGARGGGGRNKRGGKRRAEFGTGDENRSGKRGRLTHMNEKRNFWPKATGESVRLLTRLLGEELNAAFFRLGVSPLHPLRLHRL